MVFKRRDRRPIWQAVADLIWPRGGWTRAFRYVKHRLHRLPDPPHRIARGIFAGVMVTFSPLFGLHFLLAASVAWVMRGNIVAALLATFVGNPLTFLPIGVVSLQLGHFLMGRHGAIGDEVQRSLGGKFVDAGRDLKHNILSIFNDQSADWSHLTLFYDEVFLPYLVGGVVAGLIAGTIAYYLTLPVIQAYQNRRKGVLKAKWAAIREKAAQKADAKKKQD
ncbi:MAG: DUF2062 domain-containing protein [Pseudomonadota bacterium]|uniref:DUF2062 domain-containing protein n=1 Tax=Roseovarius TaxID=74030 RepID=UPI0022A83A70|nr:DUF2062 domain-containing protein [Roseovarius sp. EGI FJ00037]MCZ0813289.1 DUF2062 domain-containing protein [Roseovarius sp. EGI FJ00037]